METIKEIFKIGHGPSSSHTMGPAIASERFLEKNKEAESFKCILYGSLAKTGKGHLTDYIIEKKFRGYPSIVVQHEMDHFSGTLYYDHINKKDPLKVKPDAIQL